LTARRAKTPSRNGTSRARTKNAPVGGQADNRLGVWENEGGALARELKEAPANGRPEHPRKR